MDDDRPDEASTATPADTDTEFSKATAEKPRSIPRELLDFALHNKRWWLTPILVILILLGALIVFGGGSSLIYTLF
jgi:hypothetical protein